MHHLPSKSLLLFILPLLSYAGVALLLSPHITHAAVTCTMTISPGQSANSAASQLSPGQTLCLHGGTYAEKLESIPSGTSWSNVVRIASYPGETAVIKPSSDTGNVVYMGSSVQYVEFDGLTFDGTNISGNTFRGDGATFIRLKNSELMNGALISQDNSCPAGSPNAGGIAVSGFDNSEFLNNNIHHNSCYGFCTHANNLFDGNLVYDNGGFGFHLYSGGGGVNNNVVRNNIVHDNGFRQVYSAGAILIASGTNNLVYNNVVYDNSQGITVGFGASNTKVYNNTVYGNSDSSYGYCIGLGSASGTDIRNNICWQNARNAPGDGDGSASNTTLSNNLTSDPNFVNAGGGDFHLTSNSPARDAGTSLPDVPCDFDGNARPAGGAYDIGAYEQGGTPGSGCSKGGGPTPTPPPTPAPPIITISAIPSSISVLGQGITLSWSVTNATSCTASGGWSGPQATAGNIRFYPSQTTIYTLTCTGPGGTGQGSATVTVGTASSCTQYTYGSSIPSGFGVPWDVQNPGILLLNATCTSPTVLVKVGNQNSTNVVYVYKTAYAAPAGAPGWTPIDLFGSSLISGAWYRSFAQGIATIDTSTPSYYVGYTCSWTGQKWMCGCRDAQCGQSYWQIQRVQP